MEAGGFANEYQLDTVAFLIKATETKLEELYQSTKSRILKSANIFREYVILRKTTIALLSNTAKSIQEVTKLKLQHIGNMVRLLIRGICDDN